LAALRAASSASIKKEDKAAYIPIPDSNGVVDNYEILYPSNRWKDPHSYVQSSLTVEESASAALYGGFTYYMDERDKEWLDRNNEEARGEGTSAKGASTRRCSTSSHSDGKGKGKETDNDELQVEPMVTNEDEFELVMGLFEKIAHENTEFLYHVCRFFV
jgi:enhancer of polycomb-like protein